MKRRRGSAGSSRGGKKEARTERMAGDEKVPPRPSRTSSRKRKAGDPEGATSGPPRNQRRTNESVDIGGADVKEGPITIDGTAVKPDIKRAHVLLIAFPYRVRVPTYMPTVGGSNVRDRSISGKPRGRDIQEDLGDTRNDLPTLGNFFEDAGAVINDTVTGSLATKKHVGETLHRFFNEVDEKWGFKVVTYSGHGWYKEGERGNWVTKDEKGNDEFISLKFVLAIWGKSRAFKNGAKLCIVMECCHSGGWVKRARELYEKAPWRKILKSVAIQASCSSDEIADGLPKYGGLLTYLRSKVQDKTTLEQVKRELNEGKMISKDIPYTIQLDDKAREALSNAVKEKSSTASSSEVTELIFDLGLPGQEDKKPLTRCAAAILLHCGLTFNVKGKMVNHQYHPTFFVPWQKDSSFEQLIWSGPSDKGLYFFSCYDERLNKKFTTCR